MNKKGFAVTTMVYSAIILLTIVMFSVLAIEKSKYVDQKDYIKSTEKALNSCVRQGTC
jgi:hypothetical protein